MGGVVIETDQSWRYPLPRLKGESPDVAPGTPLAVIGLWMAALQARFSPLNLGANLGQQTEGTGYNTFDGEENVEPLPWVWDGNVNPGDECATPPGTDGQAKLLIDAAFNTDKGERNYRPAIYVDRGDVTTQKLVIDNKAGTELPTAEKGYWTIAHMPVVFECEAINVAESSLIADTAWFFILATRDIFKESFGFYDISEPLLGKTQKMETDRDVWVTPVHFAVQIELRWGTRRISPILRELGLRIRDIGTDPDIAYHQIALRDLGA
jgi:hypothetical protein